MAASIASKSFTVLKLSRASQYHLDRLVSGSEYKQPVKVPNPNDLPTTSSQQKQTAAPTFTCFELLPLELRRRIWKYYIRDQARIIEVFEPLRRKVNQEERTYPLPDILCINKETRIDALNFHKYYIYEEMRGTYECLDYAHHPDRCLETFGRPRADLSAHVYFRAKTDMLLIRGENALPRSWSNMLENLAGGARASIKCIAIHEKLIWGPFNSKTSKTVLAFLKEFTGLELLFVVMNEWQLPKCTKITFEEVFHRGYMNLTGRRTTIERGIARIVHGVRVIPELRFVAKV